MPPARSCGRRSSGVDPRDNRVGRLPLTAKAAPSSLNSCLFTCSGDYGPRLRLVLVFLLFAVGERGPICQEKRVDPIDRLFRRSASGRRAPARPEQRPIIGGLSTHGRTSSCASPPACKFTSLRASGRPPALPEWSAGRGSFARLIYDSPIALRTPSAGHSASSSEKGFNRRKTTLSSSRMVHDRKEERKGQEGLGTRV